MNPNFFKKLTLIIFIMVPCLFYSQGKNFAEEVLENYEHYKEETLNTRRFTHEDIQPLIDEVRNNPKFTVKKVGESIQGRELSLISIGTGDTSVLLWSQMHGDESTATMAIFDLLNFLASDDLQSEKEDILSKLTLHFLPMLNPDGAQLFQRRNALGIDINRDALRLQSPEGKTLKRIRDSLEADFGFNLHDQSTYYNPEKIGKPATISFLAPAYNYEKDIDEKRAASMKLIVVMNTILQKYIPGQVARYNDDFEPRAFGDNIQKWGTRTILIESGGNYNDRQKQEIRKINFLAMLSAFNSIANESYKNAEIAAYEEIPKNDRKLFNLKLTGLNYNLMGDTYILDLGINQSPIVSEQAKNGVYYRGRIADQGDLSTYFGYEHKDVSGYTMVPGKIYPKIFDGLNALKNIDFSSLLKQGYAYVKVLNPPSAINFVYFPVQIVTDVFKVPEKLNVGNNPTFFLKKNGEIQAAVINGFFTDLKNPEKDVKNGLILK